MNSPQLSHTLLVTGPLSPPPILGGDHFDRGKIVQFDDTIDSYKLDWTLSGNAQVIPLINLVGPRL